jgi:hypothetical protein
VTVALEINYPPTGTGVCNSFVAWGASNQNFPVAGNMVLGPFQINGTTLQNPGPGVPWMIGFANVPNGQGWTLFVWDTQKNGDQSSDLDVAPQFCQVKQPTPTVPPED